MGKMSLEEKMRKAKATPFSLPKEVGLKKTLLPNGVLAYVFHHNQLGELGRLVILPHQADNHNLSVRSVATLMIQRHKSGEQS